MMDRFNVFFPLTIEILLLNYSHNSQTLSPPSPTSTGGYYLTTLYASLYYISSFRPRLAARQLSVEAQHSLNQWHRRRTLHCNQSRRSKHRRTIRRQPCRDRGSQNSDTETRRKKDDCVNTDESQQQQETESSTDALQPMTEETGGGEDQSDTSALISDCQQEEVIMSKQENRQTLCTAEEEDQKGM